MIDKTAWVTYSSCSKKRKNYTFKEEKYLFIYQRIKLQNKIIKYYCIKELLLSEIIRNMYQK